MTDDQSSSPEDPAAREAAVPDASAKQTLPPAVALGFVIIALLGMLIVITVRGWQGRGADSDDIRALKAEIAAAEADLNARRISMGLRPIEGTTEPVEDVADRLKRDADTMSALASTLQSAIVEKEAQIAAKTTELLQSEQTRQALVGEIEKLRQQLGNALIGTSQSDLLRTENDMLKTQRDTLAAEAAKLRTDLNARGEGAPMSDYLALERRLEEAERARAFLEARVKELDGQVARASLFAGSERDLLPAAVDLFRSLRKLEGKSDAEIASAYSSLGVSLGANVLHTLNFATGSAELSETDQERIRSILSEIPDGDMLLAVGYASETGDVDINRSLSSDRATAAAELFSEVKRPGQNVQAIYLGQTDRFSSRIPARNQIVELWRIRHQGN